MIAAGVVLAFVFLLGYWFARGRHLAPPQSDRITLAFWTCTISWGAAAAFASLRLADVASGLTPPHIYEIPQSAAFWLQVAFALAALTSLTLLCWAWIARLQRLDRVVLAAANGGFVLLFVGCLAWADFADLFGDAGD